MLKAAGGDLADGEAEDVAVGAESLDGPCENGLHEHGNGRHVARMRSSTHARCAPSVPSAKSMLRRRFAAF